jgi:prepilin signal peptidase PulO-like enzyme (type II secretory pathway)
MDLFLLILAVAVGCLVGLLINTLADVLPAARRLSLPTCPECDGVYAFKDYVLAWRCAQCGRRHPARHGVVLVVSVAACVALVLFPVSGLPWLAWLPLLVFLGVIFVIDLEQRLVLFQTSLFGLGLCLVYGWVLHGLSSTLLGGLAGFAIMLAFFLLGALFSRIVGLLRGKKVGEVAFGFGDVFAGTFLGLLTGWPLIAGAIVIGLLVFSAFSIVYLGVLLATKRYRAFGNPLPLTPFLILGAVVMLVL